ncbi:MAG TPA: hypothetical protein VFO10_10400 [Oligoflexus sp.]|uniref:hypothetical protein n=1 Tax=Oligoflexus sp. TaxID=1971216 RepID=UPI002D7F4628|nr:hypothetical protein [Oligoflexus sp.]HET9237653.1 hypothetical protein [Oligoflexus sp.]
MKRWNRSRVVLQLGLIIGISSLWACSPRQDKETSSPLVTDVAHTISKRQSIGNCWLYATGTWLESVILSYQNETVDVSESYWTWWHFYNQLIVPREMEKIGTGGSWTEARAIILRHGFVNEGDFLPDEAGVEMSNRQKQAEYYINDSLLYGDLKDPSARTPETVRRVLDEAFGSTMADAEKLAQAADQKIIQLLPNGQVVTLRDLLDRRSRQAWVEVSFPRIVGEEAVVTPSQQRARRNLWQRVFRALNDKQPVIISLMIDFNALDPNDGTFKGQRLRELGIGHQGGHLTVLEDYTVTDVPGIGSIGRGEVSEELQAQALLGTLDTLVVKNSWGVDRPERGIKEGITLFDRSYLENQFAWKEDDEDPESPVNWYTTLGGFVLPAGY